MARHRRTTKKGKRLAVLLWGFFAGGYIVVSKFSFLRRFESGEEGKRGRGEEEGVGIGVNLEMSKRELGGGKMGRKEI